MSNFVAAANALRAALQAGFTTLPLFWPNDPRDPTLDIAPNGFVYSEARVLTEGPVTLGQTGTRTHRDVGELAIYVYVPQGKLIGTAEGYAEAIRALFGVTAISGVIVTSRTIGQGQLVSGPNGRAWSIPIIIQWFSDRTE